MKFIDLGDIEQIKKIKKNGYRGWASYLIPFCKSYFDANISVAFVQQELIELYDFQISIHTLRFIRTKYRKSLVEELSEFDLINQKTVLPKTEVKPIAPNHRKQSPQEREEKNQLLERVIKEMADFDNRPTKNRTELDDLLERQRQERLKIKLNE